MVVMLLLMIMIMMHDGKDVDGGDDHGNDNL